MERVLIVSGAKLAVMNLIGTANISAGEDGKITVTVEGDQGLIEMIKIDQAQNGDVTIDGKDIVFPGQEGEQNSGGFIQSIRNLFGGRQVTQVCTSGKGSTVIQSGGSISVGCNNRVRGRMSLGSISIKGSNIQVGDSNSDIVINGVNVTAGGNMLIIDEDGKLMINGKEAPRVTVSVPKQTAVELADVWISDTKGVGGPMTLRLSDMNRAKVAATQTLDVKASGQSECIATDIVGDTKLQVSGQSKVEAYKVAANKCSVGCSGQSYAKVEGVASSFTLSASGQANVDVRGSSGNLEVTTSGQADAKITGDVVDFDAEADGQSTIKLVGKITGTDRRRERGQADITVRG